MERTKETLEARVRETPLVDRLKECRQRIGKMCSEGRPPRMCIPVQHDDDDFFISTTLSDAQATVEALQAEKLMLERGVSAQSALIDGLQSQLIQRTAALEAVQHERDEANSHVKFLGATKQANGSFCLDMKKYHARYRCGRHRDDPWKGIDTEIDCFVCLKHALDAERELSAAWAEKAREYELELDGDPQNFHGQGRTTGLREHLTKLQALVRALPVIKTAITVYRDAGQFRVQCVEACYWFNTSDEAHAWANLLAYRATLDATTPAGGGQDGR